jgi:hypothetical protein
MFLILPTCQYGQLFGRQLIPPARPTCLPFLPYKTHQAHFKQTHSQSQLTKLQMKDEGRPFHYKSRRLPAPSAPPARRRRRRLHRHPARAAFTAAPAVCITPFVHLPRL